MDFLQVSGENLLFSAAVSFAGGFLTSLSPCIYPVIALTVAAFGAKQARSRLEAFLLSLTFASAIVVIYTTLGIVSALTGTLFGKIHASRWFTLALTGLFVAMALSLFGLFTIQLPESIRTRFAGVGRGGYLGAFLIGVVSALLATPCTSPVLIGIMAFVATTQNALIGGLLLLSFSVGFSILFIFVGTFLVSLPKSGKWLDAVKDLLGVVMLLLAVYFLRFTLPLPAPSSAHASLLLTAGGLVSAAAGVVLIVVMHVILHPLLMDGGRSSSHRRKLAFQWLRAGAIVILLAAGSAVLWSATGHHACEKLPWIINDEERAFREQQDHRKPLIIDFTAQWCEACAKIERETFCDAKVREKLKNFVLLRMDMTEMKKEDEEVQKKHQVKGLPAVLVFNSSGKEVARWNRFVSPEEIVPVLEKVR